MRYLYSIAALLLAISAQADNATLLPSDTTKVKALKIKKFDANAELITPIDTTLRVEKKPELPIEKRSKAGKKQTTSRGVNKKPAAEYKEHVRKDSVTHKEHSAGIHAAYPGGYIALMRFIRANMQYPQECKSQRLTGRTEVAMTIAPDGRITDIRLHKCSGNKYMDSEALRVAALVPQWEAAKDLDNGKDIEHVLIFNFRPGR